jgi:5-(carboxyamino)imidazole ribonucleotide synthase
LSIVLGQNHTILVGISRKRGDSLAWANVGPLGILGGGQLARMTLQAASALGIDVVIAERFADSPAARLTNASLVFDGGWNDPRALDALASLAPVVTLESEFVDAGALEQLQLRGAQVLPGPTCVATVQDKLLQKQALLRAELPVPAFAEVEQPGALRRIGDELGWPLMLKARRDGYDGYGNVLVRDPEQAEAACAKLGWPKRALFAEAFVSFERELAVIVVRAISGHRVVYPTVETRQDPELHICRVVIAPAEVEASVARQAAEIARGAVQAVDGVGTFGVELFLLDSGQVLINELAPRPHNSGHYSIEACATSQFGNHVRAVLGLPLGSAALRTPVAVMVNVLGSGRSGSGGPDFAAALSVPDVYVHLYGKAENRPGRKLGHVTALGSHADEALARAQLAVDRLRL